MSSTVLNNEAMNENLHATVTRPTSFQYNPEEGVVVVSDKDIQTNMIGMQQKKLTVRDIEGWLDEEISPSSLILSKLLQPLLNEENLLIRNDNKLNDKKHMNLMKLSKELESFTGSYDSESFAVVFIEAFRMSLARRLLPSNVGLAQHFAGESITSIDRNMAFFR